RRALGDQSAATLSCLRTHIEDPIRLGHYVQIVFDHDCRVTGLDESVQYVDQLFDIRHVQAHGRLIEHVQRVLRLHTWPGTDVAAHLRELCNKLDALCFAAGQRWALLTQGQVPQADILQELQCVVYPGMCLEEFDSILNAHRENIADAVPAPQHRQG